jgi:hypothetical protein
MGDLLDHGHRARPLSSAWISAQVGGAPAHGLIG